MKILFLSFLLFFGGVLNAQQNTTLQADYPTVRVILPENPPNPFYEQSWFGVLLGAFITLMISRYNNKRSDLSRDRDEIKTTIKELRKIKSDNAQYVGKLVHAAQEAFEANFQIQLAYKHLDSAGTTLFPGQLSDVHDNERKKFELFNSARYEYLKIANSFQPYLLDSKDYSQLITDLFEIDFGKFEYVRKDAIPSEDIVNESQNILNFVKRDLIDKILIPLEHIYQKVLDDLYAKLKVKHKWYDVTKWFIIIGVLFSVEMHAQEGTFYVSPDTKPVKFEIINPPKKWYEIYSPLIGVVFGFIGAFGIAYYNFRKAERLRILNELKLKLAGIYDSQAELTPVLIKLNKLAIDLFRHNFNHNYYYLKSTQLEEDEIDQYEDISSLSTSELSEFQTKNKLFEDLLVEATKHFHRFNTFVEISKRDDLRNLMNKLLQIEFNVFGYMNVYENDEEQKNYTEFEADVSRIREEFYLSKYRGEIINPLQRLIGSQATLVLEKIEKIENHKSFILSKWIKIKKWLIG